MKKKRERLRNAWKEEEIQKHLRFKGGVKTKLIFSINFSINYRTSTIPLRLIESATVFTIKNKSVLISFEL